MNSCPANVMAITPQALARASDIPRDSIISPCAPIRGLRLPKTSHHQKPSSTNGNEQYGNQLWSSAAPRIQPTKAVRPYRLNLKTVARFMVGA